MGLCQARGTCSVINDIQYSEVHHCSKGRSLGCTRLCEQTPGHSQLEENITSLEVRPSLGTCAVEDNIHGDFWSFIRQRQSIYAPSCETSRQFGFFEVQHPNEPPTPTFGLPRCLEAMLGLDTYASGCICMARVMLKEGLAMERMEQDQTENNSSYTYILESGTVIFEWVESDHHSRTKSVQAPVVFGPKEQIGETFPDFIHGASKEAVLWGFPSRCHELLAAKEVALQSIEALARLPPKEFKVVHKLAILATLQIGETVFEQDQSADAFYILVHGGVHSLIPPAGEQSRIADGPDSKFCGEIVNSIKPGDVFGEAVVRQDDPENGKRSATVVTSMPNTVCWMVPLHPSMLPRIKTLAFDLEMRLRCRVLKSTQLLREVSDLELRRLASAAKIMHLSSGEILFKEGDEASSVYIIERGALKFCRDGVTKGILVAGEGGFFGEAGLVQNDSRRATGIALKDSTVYVVTNNEFTSKGVNDVILGDAKTQYAARKQSIVTTYGSLEPLRQIGEGGFGIVSLCRDRLTGKLVASKAQRICNDKEARTVMTEISLMRQLQAGGSSCAFVLNLVGCYENQSQSHGKRCMFLMLEPAICSLHDLRTSTPCGIFDISTARFYIAQLCMALEFVHQAHIVHCDVKLDNLLVFENGYVKLCDFGLAQKQRHDCSALSLTQGTPAYMAPEIWLYSGYGVGVDWWAAGIACYEMVSGRFAPFGIESKSVMRALTRFVECGPKIMFDHILFDRNHTLADFIKKLLEPRQEKRLSDGEILLHDFFNKEELDQIRLLQRPPPPQFKRMTKSK